MVQPEGRSGRNGVEWHVDGGQQRAVIGAAHVQIDDAAGVPRQHVIDRDEWRKPGVGQEGRREAVFGPSTSAAPAPLTEAQQAASCASWRVHPGSGQRDTTRHT
jgi:hypothetical protein